MRACPQPGAFGRTGSRLTRALAFSVVTTITNAIVTASAAATGTHDGVAAPVKQSWPSRSDVDMRAPPQHAPWKPNFDAVGLMQTGGEEASPMWFDGKLYFAQSVMGNPGNNRSKVR
jgi:hypothetical protein